MQRPPRPPGAPLLSPGLIAWSLVQGALVLGGVGGGYWGLLHSGVPEGQARAAAFGALVLANVGLILSNRSFTAPLWQTLRRPNPVLWAMLATTLALLAAMLSLAPLRALFGFCVPATWALGGALLTGVALLALLELLKPLGARLRSRR